MSTQYQEPKPLLPIQTSSSNEDANDNIINQSSCLKIKPPVKYMDCLKNHAAAIGGNATDGCGEFMPGGEEGSLEALICSACNCHRNFHRKIHIHNEAMLYPSPFTPPVIKKTPNPGEGEGSEQVKKRFRTKFSQEQKEKMLVFAEKSEWKIQKLDDAEVRGFCQEIGIKRKVLKVWMHNNKYHFKKINN